MVSRMMSLRGFRAFHRWSCQDLASFFQTNGYRLLESRTVDGVIPLVLPFLQKSGES